MSRSTNSFALLCDVSEDGVLVMQAPEVTKKTGASASLAKQRKTPGLEKKSVVVSNSTSNKSQGSTDRPGKQDERQDTRKQGSAASRDNAMGNKKERNPAGSSVQPSSQEAGGEFSTTERRAGHDDRRPAKQGHHEVARRAPNHGREFDRHSGTGKYDSKKKEVVEHSWGPLVDVPAGSTVDEAIAITDNAVDSVVEGQAETKETAEPSNAVEGDEAEKEVQKVDAPKKTLDVFLSEQKNKKSSLKVKFQPLRKANEGVEFQEYVENKEVVEDKLFAALFEPVVVEPKVAKTTGGKKKAQKEKRIFLEPKFVSLSATSRFEAGSERNREERRPPRRTGNDGEARPRRRFDGQEGERRTFDQRTAPRGSRGPQREAPAQTST